MVVDEIYDVLVSRFGVEETCITAFSRTKRKATSWKEFITAAHKESGDTLAKILGFSSASTFSRYLRDKFPYICTDRGKRSWRLYLLSLIEYKLCSKCGEILPQTRFTINKSHQDGLESSCKTCRGVYTINNKEKILEYSKVHYELNKYTIKQQHREYYYNNKYLFNAKAAKRRATKVQATPNWGNLIAIKEIYRTCPEGYHVDHIVPLQNKLVCGLHCEFNLQHLPIKENLSKGNRFEVC